MFPLRLPALRMEQLRRLAAARGVSPGALAVDWVLERLDQEDTETGPLPIAVDVETPAWRTALRRLGRQQVDQSSESATRAGLRSARHGLPLSRVTSTASASAR